MKSTLNNKCEQPRFSDWWHDWDKSMIKKQIQSPQWNQNNQSNFDDYYLEDNSFSRNLRDIVNKKR